MAKGATKTYIIGRFYDASALEDVVMVDFKSIDELKKYLIEDADEVGFEEIEYMVVELDKVRTFRATRPDYHSIEEIK